MAIALTTSSSLFISKYSPSSSSPRTTPFLGFSLSASTNKPSLQSNRLFYICCQDKSSAIPAEQQWMFDDLTGPDVWNKTWYPKAKDHIPTSKTWYIVDASDKILGRLASTIAIHIRGKNLATYTPSVDMELMILENNGSVTSQVNAEKVAISGKKRTQKLYRRHSGTPGGMKVETFDQLQKRIPERIIEHAVRGMLPKGRLGRSLFTHLKVYTGPDHPHEAQQPKELPIRDKRITKQTFVHVVQYSLHHRLSWRFASRMDKAAPLGHVVDHVKEQRQRAKEASKISSGVPSEIDEVIVDQIEDGSEQIKSSICCDDRPSSSRRSGAL
ncbi:hypothetical protein SASPL_156569 [Salvia splendens]|uniref:Large subunit ribosomal protein L13 n=1 Tax=Salvia splendens TaxID=180675 RepID=A0A8X8YWK8_SALSN|nr:hypothetical protein SASPL_156569 [Salvia splendens]